MNDWNIERFLGTVLLVQAAALIAIGLDHYGVRLPIIRQIVLFIYLTFIPGVLLLRALGIHKLGPLVNAMYAVGLSLAMLMFTGLFLNLFLPLAGFAEPITLLPLTAMLTILVLALCVICYLRDSDYEGDAILELNVDHAPQALLLALVPFLAIFGTYLMNHYGDNALLLIMMLVIAVIVLLVGFDTLIPKELYPLAIFVIAISLLFHNSLISNSLIGWDIHQEKYLADSVVNSGYWNISIDQVVNSMLSIMMLAPLYSIFLDMDTIWIYKVIFPLLFAFVPVVLYQVYRKQSDDKIAFMATFFFVSLVVYFSEMLQLARQEIAEMFLALILLLIIDRSMEKARWSVLFLIFTASLVLSHYGLTFIFMGTIVLAWTLLFVISKVKKDDAKDRNRRLTPMLIMGFMVFCIIWYIYTSASNPFETIIYVSQRVERPIVTFANQFLTQGTPPAPSTMVPGQGTPAQPPPAVTQPMTLIQTGGSASLLHRIFVYLLLSTQVFLVVGLLTSYFIKGAMKIRREFYALAFVNVLMLAATLVMPYFASAINTTRLYQIALIILAPFFVLGWINIFKALGIVTKRSASGTLAVSVGVLSIFLVLYLIFNTGLIFNVARDVPMSYSLDKNGANLTYTIYNGMEVAGAGWTFAARDLVAMATNSTYVPPIFSDTYRWLLLQDWNTSRSYQIPTIADQIPKNSYVYLGTFNVVNDRAINIRFGDQSQEIALVDLAGVMGTRDKIYANGGSDVYY